MVGARHTTSGRLGGSGLRFRASLGILVAAGLMALLAPAATLGQSITVPPGNSEADQYFEVTPDATGDKSTDGSRTPEEVLTENQLAALQELGVDGESAAALAAQTAPVAPAGDGASGGAGGDEATDESGEVIVAQAATGREGMGAWLWVIIAASAIVAAAIGVARWRSAGGGSSR
ncbi:MAG: hypothetical protein ACR2N5_04250 [Solirubrobacterales bacterium]